MLLGTRNEAVFEEGSRTSVAGMKTFEAALASIDIAHSDRTAAIDFAHRVTYSVCAHLVVQGEFLSSDRPPPWDDLRRRLQDTVISYLLG